MDNLNDQDRNTTAVYVDGTRVAQFDGNGYTEENAALDKYRGQGKIFFERTVFGHGRVALKFRTRKFQ